MRFKLFKLFLISALASLPAFGERVCSNGVCFDSNSLPKLPKSNTPLERLDKTGVFFGFDQGIMLGSYTDVNNAKEGGVNSLSNGVKLGYNMYFSKPLGVRIYGQFQTTYKPFTHAAPASLKEVLPMDATFNLDFLYDPYSTKVTTLGFILGIGIGYSFEKNNTPNDYYAGIIMPINVGISMLMNGHHKLEILSKIPTFNAPYWHSSNGNINFAQAANNNFSYTILSIGYSYNF